MAKKLHKNDVYALSTKRKKLLEYNIILVIKA